MMSLMCHTRILTALHLTSQNRRPCSLTHRLIVLSCSMVGLSVQFQCRAKWPWVRACTSWELRQRILFVFIFTVVGVKQARPFLLLSSTIIILLRLSRGPEGTTFGSAALASVCHDDNGCWCNLTSSDESLHVALEVAEAHERGALVLWKVAADAWRIAARARVKQHTELVIVDLVLIAANPLQVLL